MDDAFYFDFLHLVSKKSRCAALGPDGATYRELKAALDINDGVLFANLNVLKEMGYLAPVKITSEGKKLESIPSRPKGRTTGRDHDPGCAGSSTVVHGVWKNGDPESLRDRGRAERSPPQRVR